MNKLTVKKQLFTYQSDRYGFIRPITLMNELQAVADNHAEILGAGRTYCCEKNLAWVVTHYMVDIVSVPTENQELFITTWPVVSGGLKAIRDFEIRDADDNLLVRATSQWILIDLQTRRPLRYGEHLSGWELLSDRAYDAEFAKFPDFEADKTLQFKCRYDDLDVNQHINNSVYAVWATESVGFEFRNSHKLKRLNINFKKEIKPDVSNVDVAVKMDGLVSHHKIMTGGEENACVICEWEVR